MWIGKFFEIVYSKYSLHSSLIEEKSTVDKESEPLIRVLPPRPKGVTLSETLVHKDIMPVAPVNKGKGLP